MNVAGTDSSCATLPSPLLLSYNLAPFSSLVRSHPRQMKSSRLSLWIVCALLLPLGACSPTIRRPQWLHPGPEWYQRRNAEEFDPYPMNDLGPAIVGGRPRGFQKPAPEVVRSRQQQPLGPLRAPAPRY